MNNENFLPEEYKVPGGGAYMKFKDGENRFRIVSKPIIGWEDWEDRKPIRFRINNKPSHPINQDQPIKHFWAMVVFDYSDKQVKILQITQKSLQNAIQNYSKDEDWGNPLGYDLKVTKKGSGLETEYSLIPIPAKPLSDEAKEIVMEKGLINLEAMFEGGDPFEKKSVTKIDDDLPF